MTTNKANQRFGGRCQGSSFSCLAIVGCFFVILVRESSAFVPPSYVLSTFPGASTLNNPTGIHYDGPSDKLYVAEGSKAGIPAQFSVIQGGVKTNFAGPGGTYTTPVAGVSTRATSAAFNTATDVWGDTNGNLFVSSSGGNMLRKVTPDGMITNFAGTGTAASSGDGGQATSASIKGPMYFSLDADGNTFIAESSGHRIRKVSGSTGLISTVAGTGTVGTPTEGGVATTENLNQPSHAIANPAGDIFFVCWNDPKLRWVPAASGRIYTLAGGSASATPTTVAGGPSNTFQFSYPTYLWMDAQQNIFVNEYVGSRVDVLSKESDYGMLYRVSNGMAFSSNFAMGGDQATGRLFVSNQYTGVVNALTQVVVPSVAPSRNPTLSPTRAPTAPTVQPSAAPSVLPTRLPSATPSTSPSVTPSVEPTTTPSEQPSVEPSVVPSITPSVLPTVEPSISPSVEPTATPSELPSVEPSSEPSATPTVTPTVEPSVAPSAEPSVSPSELPSIEPSATPTVTPTETPTVEPTTAPSPSPTAPPTVSPTKATCPGDCCQWRSSKTTTTTATTYGPNGEEVNKVVTTLVEYF